MIKLPHYCLCSTCHWQLFSWLESFYVLFELLLPVGEDEEREEDRLSKRMRRKYHITMLALLL